MGRKLVAEQGGAGLGDHAPVIDDMACMMMDHCVEVTFTYHFLNIHNLLCSCICVYALFMLTFAYHMLNIDISNR